MGQTYLFLSGKGGTGKTTLSTSLGMALARKGKRTVLVDADVGIRCADLLLGLENDILSGVYPKGTILTELALCEELGVSRTPVREVLKRLEQEHIVEDCGRGMLVLSITARDAEIIYEIREKIEGMAAAACAREIDAEGIAEYNKVDCMHLSRHGHAQLADHLAGLIPTLFA